MSLFNFRNLPAAPTTDPIRKWIVPGGDAANNEPDPAPVVSQYPRIPAPAIPVPILEDEPVTISAPIPKAATIPAIAKSPDMPPPQLNLIDTLRGIKQKIIDFTTTPIQKGKKYRVVIDHVDDKKLATWKGKTYALLGVTLTIFDAGQYDSKRSYFSIEIGRS